MNVRRFDRRKVDLSDAAMRALQTIAHLDHLTAGEALERLIIDFLELRWDEISEMEQTMPVPLTRRPPAKVIDIEAHRSRRSLQRTHQIGDVMQRSQALRAHSVRLCERARAVRTVARQQLRDADQAWLPA
jgi:hypothetical protein